MSPRTQRTPVRTLEALPAETVLTGLPVATVEITPDELSSRGELSWSELDSELGPVLVAVVRMADAGPRFALSSYRDAPWASVTIEADRTASEADVEALLRALGVEAGEITDRVAVRTIGGRTRSTKTTGSRRAKASKETQRVGRARRKGSDTRAAEALGFVQGQPGITIPELAHKMGIKQNYLYRVMPDLAEKGKIRKDGKHWHPAGRSTQRL